MYVNYRTINIIVFVIVVLYELAYTNVTIGEQFRNFMEIYNVMELYVFHSSKILLYNLKLYNGS